MSEMNAMHQHQQMIAGGGGAPPGMTSPASKYAGLLGLGGFLPNSGIGGQHLSPSPSQASDKMRSSVSPPPSSNADDTPIRNHKETPSPQLQRMWDLHYERKNSSSDNLNHEGSDTIEGMRTPIAASARSEGLAA